MSARHGTNACYASGCRRLECTNAHRIHREAWVLGTLRGVKYQLPATGTTRRIHALMRIGWASQSIAERCGWTTGNAVLEVAQRTRVGKATAATLAAVYDDLCMTAGPSAITRTRAAAAGWAPPLAWDDIDDADARPDLGALSHGLDLDEWARLVRYGSNPTAAATRCDVTLSAVEQAARRGDRPDILALLRRAA